jgi:hypothetical protein
MQHSHLRLFSSIPAEQQPHLPSSLHLSESEMRLGTTRVRMGMGGRYLATSSAV